MTSLAVAGRLGESSGAAYGDVAQLLADVHRELCAGGSSGTGGTADIGMLLEILAVLRAQLERFDPQLATAFVFFGLFDACCKEGPSAFRSPEIDLKKFEHCLLISLEFTAFLGQLGDAATVPIDLHRQ